jgi:ribokinase
MAYAERDRDRYSTVTARARTLDLSSERGVAEAAACLLAAGPCNVVIKRGGKGVYIVGNDCKASFIPAPVVEVVDTTAAGDAFNGGFAFALAEGKSPIDSARFACSVAAYSVTGEGAQKSMPSLNDLNDCKLLRRVIR